MGNCTGAMYCSKCGRLRWGFAAADTRGYCTCADNHDAPEPTYQIPTPAPSGEQPNDLLVIKLKDMDSVPEVYYKGQRLSDRLYDIQYRYHTAGEESANDGFGINEMSIEAYDVSKECSGNGATTATFDTIKHKRVP